jgi:hypothetical protein
MYGVSGRGKCGPEQPQWARKPSLSQLGPIQELIHAKA